MSATVVDAVVIGAGMAGLSAGAELARDRSVAVLERESVPAFHTTGRSAARWPSSLARWCRKPWPGGAPS